MSAAEDRSELERLEEEWMGAMQARDMDRLEELVADGFRFTAHPPNPQPKPRAPGEGGGGSPCAPTPVTPEPMTREQWMGAAREGYTIVSYAFEKMEVDVFGDTA